MGPSLGIINLRRLPAKAVNCPVAKECPLESAVIFVAFSPPHRFHGYARRDVTAYMGDHEPKIGLCADISGSCS